MDPSLIAAIASLAAGIVVMWRRGNEREARQEAQYDALAARLAKVEDEGREQAERHGRELRGLAERTQAALVESSAAQRDLAHTLRHVARAIQGLPCGGGIALQQLGMQGEDTPAPHQEHA